MDYQLDLDWNDFLQRYWQKRPVVLKNVFKNFVDPITPDELAGLAMESEIDSRLVSQPNDHWQASNGPFESYDHLGEKGWSLLVQAVDHWHTPSAELVIPFRKLPAWRFDDLMISFSVPEGGVGPHIDNYDVFIIQGMGSRRWRVGEALELKQYCPHPALLHVEPFDSIIDEVLETGDMLYIPAGFPHDGYTIETAMNYSIGFRGPSARDLISSFADYVLEHDLGSNHYRDPDLVLTKEIALVQAKEVERLRSMMHQLIDNPVTFEHWLGQFVTTSLHGLDIAPPDPPYQSEEIYDLLHQGEVLLRLNGLRVLRVGDSYFVNGEPIITTHPAAADSLCRHTVVTKEALGEALESEVFVDLLTELVNSGYWYFED